MHSRDEIRPAHERTEHRHAEAIPFVLPVNRRPLSSRYGAQPRSANSEPRTIREDESRARMGASAENLVVFQHIARNLLKQEQTAKVGIKTSGSRRAGMPALCSKSSVDEMRLPCHWPTPGRDAPVVVAGYSPLQQ